MQNTIKGYGLKGLGGRGGSGGWHCFVSGAIDGTHAHGAGTSPYVFADDPGQQIGGRQCSQKVE
jgi:hypothetical protein